MAPSVPSLRPVTLVCASAVGLLAALPSPAFSPQEAIRTATAACLDSAAQQGWRTDLARVTSSRVLDADRVEVVFELSRDGRNSARLTCPYSLSRGVAAGFAAAVPGGAGAAGAVGSAAAGASPAGAGGAITPLQIVPQGAAAPEAAAPEAAASDAAARGAAKVPSAWWLLLPLGLGVLSWAALRGRDAGLNAAVPGGPVRRGLTTPRNITVEAHAHEGELEVHERADIATRILRRVRNGELVQLTGHRLNDWLEVVNGGWVRDIDVRYDRSGVRFS